MVLKEPFKLKATLMVKCDRDPVLSIIETFEGRRSFFFSYDVVQVFVVLVVRFKLAQKMRMFLN